MIGVSFGCHRSGGAAGIPVATLRWRCLLLIATWSACCAADGEVHAVPLAGHLADSRGYGTAGRRTANATVAHAEPADSRIQFGGADDTSQDRILRGRMWAWEPYADWQWPEAALLTIGNLEPAFSEVVVQAGVFYDSLRIEVPGQLCTTLNSSRGGVGRHSNASASSYALAAHVHDPYFLNASVSFNDSLDVQLFLGPTTDNGYLITLNNSGSFYIVHRGPIDEAKRRRNRLPGVEFATGHIGSAGSRGQVWLLYSVSKDIASVQVGVGPSFMHDVVLTFTDPYPPSGASDILNLWMVNRDFGATSADEVQVCLEGNPTVHGGDHESPMVKVVRATANRHDCRNPSVDVPIFAGTSGYELAAWALRLRVEDGRLVTSAERFSFMNGGRYRFCYKPDANNSCQCSSLDECNCTADGARCSRPVEFGTRSICNPFALRPERNNLLFSDLAVLGVSSQCQTAGCLARERWDCFHTAFGQWSSPCRIDFSPESGRSGWQLHAGSTSRMTWTALWEADSLRQGLLYEEHPQPCGQASLIPSGMVYASAHANETFPVLPKTYAVVELKHQRSNSPGPFTTTLCYCPAVASDQGRGPCGSAQDYVQPFGRLYMWVFHMCDGDDRWPCASPHHSVVPQQRFVARVSCPPGRGCRGGLGNRIKVLDWQDTAVDAPSWDSEHACRRIHVESSFAIWPEARYSLTQHGGDRADYKVWSEQMLSLNAPLGTAFMVCYCDDNCDDPPNWFQVGHARTSTAVAFASGTNDGSFMSPRVETVSYVNKPGSLTLFGGITSDPAEPHASPFDSNKFSGLILLKLISFDRDVGAGSTLEDKYKFSDNGLVELQGAMERECKSTKFQWGLVDGLENEADAYYRRAEIQQYNRYMAFDGGGEGHEIIVKKAGTLAVCYCARTSQGACVVNSFWRFAGLYQIRGPRGGQLWVLPTRMNVQIDALEGWGLDHKDRLRILDEASLCSQHEWSPVGSENYKVGCPRGSRTSATCRVAAATEEIRVSLASSASTGVYLTGLEVEGPRSSVLTFSGRIKDYLLEGDSITIRPENILVNGSGLDDMTEQQKYDAFTLAGSMPFMDDVSQRFFRRPHPVKYLAEHEDATSNRDSTVGTKLRIPVGWAHDHVSGPPAFTFTADDTDEGNPQWARRTSLSTDSELKASDARRMRVCWATRPDGVSDTEPAKVLADAGEISFVDPQAMAFVTLGLTTKRIGAVAPLVVSFTTSPRSIAYSTAARGEMMLTIRVRNAAKLMITTTSRALIHASSSLPANLMSQAACGDLFAELWSNDPRGFPVPKGCFYGTVGDTGEQQEREFHVVFDRYNGLRHRCATFRSYCVYQLVLHANVSSVSAEEAAVDIYTGCRYEAGGCRRKFELYERGTALYDTVTLPGAVPSESATLHPTHGFQILSDDAGNATAAVRELGSPGSVEGLLTPSGSPGIGRGATLRIYLSPLTVWDLTSSDCNAECRLSSSGGSCGAEPFFLCKTEAVGSSQGFETVRYNALKLRFPDDMDDALGSKMLKILISHVPAPTAAFFPTTMGLQLTDATDRSPHYVISVGYLKFLGPTSPASDARLLVVGPSGSGLHPFVGNSNTLYARLRFAATLWAGPATLGVGRGSFRDVGRATQASIEIYLPPGYTCSVHQDGRVPHSFDGNGAYENYTLLADTDVPYDRMVESLFLLDRDSDELADYARATISSARVDGSWSQSAKRTCVYRLQPGQAIFAGQVAYLQMDVHNPSVPMVASAANNTWNTHLRGRGYLEDGDLYATQFTRFAAGGDDTALWTNNAAVLASMSSPMIQPSHFGAGSENFLSVFVPTVQDLGYGGQIIVDAPFGFAFGADCVLEELGDAYYDSQDAFGNTLRLVDPGPCRGEASIGAGGVGTNRARIRVYGRISGGRVYAFKLRITNPAAEVPDWKWYIWTALKDGSLVDGTSQPIPFSSAHGDRWQVYPQRWPRSPAVFVANLLRPYNVFRTLETLVVDGLQVPGDDDVQTNIRVTAPSCCCFEDPARSDFATFSSSSTATLPQSPRVSGNEQQLMWVALKLQAHQVYGFEAKFRVVSIPTHYRSMHWFTLEIGWMASKPEKRIGAVVAEAPALRSISHASVRYLSTRVGFHRNVLQFYFTLATAVPASMNSVLIFQGSESLRGSNLFCRPTAVAGTALEKLPHGLSCTAGVDNLGAPYMQLEPLSAPMMNGSYILEVRASNPVASPGTTVTWSIGTYSSTENHLGREPLDANVVLPAVVLHGPMKAASLVWGDLNVDADHRPGRINTVILKFSLELATDVQPLASTLLVHAPEGFAFPENCFLRVFNGSTLAQFVQSYEAREVQLWPMESAPTSCYGSDTQAMIKVPRGLLPGHTYVMSLSVRNPMHTPAQNFWTLDYDLEASTPLAGMPISMITFPVSIRTVSNAVGYALEPVPISIIFLLEHTVSGGGEMHIVAPAGFTLLNVTALQAHKIGPGDGTSSRDIVNSERRGETLVAHVPPDSHLIADQPHHLQVLVQNPQTMPKEPGLWILSSMNTSGAPLDEGQVDSFPLVPAASLYVRNEYSEWHSMRAVTIIIGIATPMDVRFDDEVKLEAPRGFDLGSKPPHCAGFAWLSWESSAPRPNIECRCLLGPCILSIRFGANIEQRYHYDGIAYRADTQMSFRFASRNPPRNPSLADSYWRLTHLTGVNASATASSAAVRSWQIQPELTYAAVQLVGSNQAAGADSDLLITFLPVSNADAAWLVAEYPKEMTFDGASVEAPQQKDRRSVGPNLVVTHLRLVAGVQASILAKAVQLGRGGGQSIFSLTTFTDADLRHKVDELLRFEGFHQPGRVTAEGALQGYYAAQPEFYPVRSLLDARSAEEARVVFSMGFSLALNAGDHLVISCEGSGAYQLKVDQRVSAAGLGTDGVTRDPMNIQVRARSVHSVDIQLQGYAQSTMVENEAAVNSGSATAAPTSILVEAGRVVEVQLWTLPQLGINKWLIQTFTLNSTDLLLTNTNDGSSAGFAPVSQLQALIQAPRSPPMTTIELSLRVSASAGAPTVPELLIIAPPGFTIPSPSCGDICTSRGDTFKLTGRSTATLTSLVSTTLLDVDHQILVNTPMRTPAHLTWIIQAQGLAGQSVGWAAVEGFKVNQMRDAAVFYGALANMKRAQVAFQFVISKVAEEQLVTIIEILAPQGYIFDCSPNKLRPISLPGGKPYCERAGPGEMRMSLTAGGGFADATITLGVGAYAFAAEAALPASTPSPNTFAIRIKERTSEAIADAAYDVFGFPFIELQMSQPTVAWTTAGYDEIARVTIGFTMNDITSQILVLLISLPSGFQHRVRTTADMKISNVRLPLMRGGSDWLDSSAADRLRALLETADPAISIGSYLLSFPVQLPESADKVSPWNIWRLSLCKDRSCFLPSDASVLASFPMAGFVPGQVSVLEQQRAQSAVDSVGASGMVANGVRARLPHFVRVLLLAGTVMLWSDLSENLPSALR